MRDGVPRVGERFRDCAQCPEMVVVPAGSFLMGSPESEWEPWVRYDDERPAHRVTIAVSFAVGVYEVTFAEWDACKADGGCSASPYDQGWGRGQRPVVSVRWDDAQEYVRWLSAKTGKRYRLPSESEWEYTARAGTRTPFHTGATISTAQANYDGDHVYGSGRKGVDREQTVPVGEFGPNEWGLHDVHGNVWEWTEDCWNGSYEGAPADGSPWTRGDCDVRVIRGGSWENPPSASRSASRARSHRATRNGDLGFRVVRRELESKAVALLSDSGARAEPDLHDAPTEHPRADKTPEREAMAWPGLECMGSVGHVEHVSHGIIECRNCHAPTIDAAMQRMATVRELKDAPIYNLRWRSGDNGGNGARLFWAGLWPKNGECQLFAYGSFDDQCSVDLHGDFSCGGWPVG